MKVSEGAINLIKEFEGCRLDAYKCPAGVWTIGYGHTGKVDGKSVCAGMKITSEKATKLLKQDLGTYEKAVSSCKNLIFKPNQNQFDALVSFTYNCGAGSLGALVNGRDAATVSEKLLLYNKANGKVLAGLHRRREAERKLFNTPVKASAPKKQKPSSEKKSVAEIAKEVIAGRWGNGPERKEKLKAAGYDYNAVQKKVNELLK